MTFENTYSREEISALRGIFSLYDTDDSGHISTRELEAVLQKIGRTGEDSDKILAAAEEFGEQITFDDFLAILEKGNKEVPGEGSDPKVMEFLRILEEVRTNDSERIKQTLSPSLTHSFTHSFTHSLTLSHITY